MPAMPQLAQQNLPVNQLIEMYSNGVIAIPEIQRDFGLGCNPHQIIAGFNPKCLSFRCDNSLAARVQDTK